MRPAVLTCAVICFAATFCGDAVAGEYADDTVGLWDRFERTVPNDRSYSDPYRDVTLNVTYTKPDGSRVRFWGFHDGGSRWIIRFMPDQLGPWKYRAEFSDGSPGISGTFTCVESDLPGMISKDETNPVWFGYKGGAHELVRSFHIGDRFFAVNWPDKDRKRFLDWATRQGYNMLSIASHYLNRDSEGRGKGWDTPALWNSTTRRPDPREYHKAEVILDDLSARRILVYPFAGFLGRDSHRPTDPADRTLYIRYTLARFGCYWNLLFNLAGPEPLLRGKPFLAADLDSLGAEIKKLDVFGHLLSVHNRTGDDQFKDKPYTDYGILQGPKTTDRTKLSRGVLKNHHPDKPLYVQETLWPGNKYHPKYSDEDIRKNAYVLIMSATAINFADMNGNSSSGFSGTMDFSQKRQKRHDIIKRVWDFFETIPFWRMTPNQNLVDNGYCLAEPGWQYLVYLESPGKVIVETAPGTYTVRWIDARNTARTINAGTIAEPESLKSPPNGDDWLLYLKRTP
jgi:hypothetical protein